MVTRLLAACQSALCAALVGAAEPGAGPLWPDIIPKDMSGTLRDVRANGELAVGVVHDPPWVDVTEDPPTGLEIEVMKAFADALRVTPEWRVVSLDEAIHLLERHELQAVVGGLTRATPYARAAYTRPYVTTTFAPGPRQHHVIAVQQGENRFLVTLERFLDRNAEMIRKEVDRATDASR